MTMRALPSRSCIIVGGGPAGLMAAETLLACGHAVDLYDAMPSLGRKFLMAGKGGMNITHSEPLETFLTRYGAARPVLEPMLRAFGPDDLRAWCRDLGIDTFVGTSGRVFPTAFKAAPLLRAWLRRLRAAGLRVHVRHRWQGWEETGALRFAGPEGAVSVRADAVVLALGGGSWGKLGSDGAWVPLLRAAGAPVADLKPANCGFDVGWSEHFRERFAGQPLKAVTVSVAGHSRQGEAMITATGLEGGAVYALSAALRDAIARDGTVALHLDLLPDRSVERVAQDLGRPRGSRSLASHLKRQVGLTGVKAGLVREVLAKDILDDPARLAAALKALPLCLISPRPLDEAISSAGGVGFGGLDDRLMLRARPGVFCAGEMLDWEAPTGGYLLTACFASGHAAGTGAAAWLAETGRGRSTA